MMIRDDKYSQGIIYSWLNWNKLNSLEYSREFVLLVYAVQEIKYSLQLQCWQDSKKIKLSGQLIGRLHISFLGGNSRILDLTSRLLLLPISRILLWASLRQYLSVSPKISKSMSAPHGRETIISNLHSVGDANGPVSLIH